MAWNPFVLTVEGKALLSIPSCRDRRSIVELLCQLGELEPRAGTVLESSDAARMTCTALLSVFERRAGKSAAQRGLEIPYGLCSRCNHRGRRLDMADEAVDLVVCASENAQDHQAESSPGCGCRWSRSTKKTTRM